MKKFPAIMKLQDVVENYHTASVQIGNRWLPARPLPFYGRFYRLKAAWLVFTGRADALVWPGGQ